MTRLHIDDGDLVVRLPWRWALAARRRTVRLPLKFVDEVGIEPHWWRAVRPRPGHRYRFRPGRWCVGELEHARGRDFVALRAQGPVLVISTSVGRDALYARLALSADDPDAAAAWLREVAAKSADDRLSLGLSTFRLRCISEREAKDAGTASRRDENADAYGSLPRA
ncbi:hypothetical protein [Streptomyces sp. NPDC052015]|uniref:hypothetical protein n=1 Tax=Streptomyces sp. NPDC052015 TaxID=3154755 RepID=UPI0034353F3F